MDPASPPRSGLPGSAPRRRHATTDTPATGATTAVVDPAGSAYDGYDGRYSGARVPRQAGEAPAGLGGPDRRTPVRPQRRGGSGRPAAPGTRAAARSGSAEPGFLSARRIGVGVLAGAFLMLAIATVDSLAGTNMPVLGSFAPPTGGNEADADIPEAPPPPDTAGVCLTWKRSDAADTAAVDCAKPHLFEQAGNVKLVDQPTFPTDDGWQKLVGDRCTPIVTGYLKNKFDPDGRFRIGALKPSKQRWDGGDRGMRCGLQTATRSGAMQPITGTVASQDQSAIVNPGVCLGIDGKTVGDPVSSCNQPHAVEAVGVMDLGPQFKDKFPSVEDQDGFLQPACVKAANDFAGNDQVIGQKNLTVYWDNLSEASWNAGSRKVNCNLATLLPDGSGFAAITGSVRGALTVAGPPAPAAPGNGAPANGAPASGAPASGAPANGAPPAGQPSAGGNPSPSPAPGGTTAPAPGAPGSPNVPPGLPGLAP